MKIVLVNRYFFPDHSATSQILTDLAFHLASQGREVHIITSRQRYDEPAARLPPLESVRGVTVHRIWTSTFGRGNLFGRAFDYLTFYFFTGMALLRLLRRGDVVVAKTDPPLLSLVASPVARLKGARLVNWLQDLFPEVAGAVGMSWVKGRIGRLLGAMRDRTLHSSYATVVTGTRMKHYLASRGVPENKLWVIHNWAAGALTRPINPEDNALRRQWRLDRKFVVGYSGNMGRVHEFETILGAMEALKDDGGTVFLFIGGGAQRPWLEAQARERGLSNVRFMPYQPRERLAESLSVPDVHLISLLPEVEGFVVPSKFYGIAAAGRPSIFVGSTEGEIAGLINEFKCGTVVRTGDVEGLSAAIARFRDESALRQEYGRNARTIFEQKFHKHIALAAWSAVL